MRPFLACVLLILAATPALAADDTSAQALLDKCNLTPVAEKMAKYDAGFCIGIIVTVMSVGPDLMHESRFCPPNHIPIVGIGTLERYLKAHPEAKDEKVLSVLGKAYMKAWPCK